METISAMPLSSGSSMSPADIKALMSNGGSDIFGSGNGGGLITLLLLFGLFGQNGLGGNSNQSTQDTILRAIDGSDADVRYLGQILNTDVSSIQQGIASIQNGITAQTGAIVSSSKDVINSIESGQCTLSKELASCCCEQLRAIDALTLNNCQQTNTLTAAITENRFNNQMGFTTLGNTLREQASGISNQLTNGFNQNAFAIQAQTNELGNVIKAEGQATRELIRDDRFADLEKENLALRTEVGNAKLYSDIVTACGCACPSSGSSKSSNG